MNGLKLSRHVALSAVCNLLFGFVFFFVAGSWVISFRYLLSKFGWLLDSTLEDGFLQFFMFIAITSSLLFFPVWIVTNKAMVNAIPVRRATYFWVNVAGFLTGVYLGFVSLQLF
ncbi:hypothetical protein LC085_17395 [Bacillus tianshenii]|uniref:hypothetical protein n=1 Tax=Sutcliffiella tianshenii TaxID=1463404 RepID=UPI001CD5CC2B|nr:hypothetical protein [Bacillus tianshenii]MCA1321684.1 hypothetical protein [Bacillus tianshenii]